MRAQLEKSAAMSKLAEKSEEKHNWINMTV